MEKEAAKLVPITYKRFNSVLDFIEKGEVKAYRKIMRLGNSREGTIRRKKFKFPEDMFPLKNSPIEWWYFNGHLSSGKKKFGMEFCFFKFNPKDIRLGVIPLSLLKKEPYLVLHEALTDKQKGSFIFSQKSGLLLENKFGAGVNMHLGGNSLIWKNGFEIKSKFFNLFAKPTKKLILHYDHGFKQYKSSPKNRTYYVSFTRMNTTGFLVQNGKKYPVKGEMWFDHQKSTTPKNPVLWGWDWFGIMFDDGTELMVTGLRRRKDLRTDDLSGSYITKSSKKVNLIREDIHLTCLSSWKSDKTGINYPSKWSLKINKLGLDLIISPCLKNQEVDALPSSGISYWEGACDVTGKKKGKKIKGNAYTELVGYDTRLVSNILRRSVL